MNGRSVVTTVCNGKVLMKDRKVLVADEKLVMQDAARARRSSGSQSTDKQNQLQAQHNCCAISIKI
jgi:hypothetical protein